jgi:hypothetical protein
MGNNVSNAPTFLTLQEFENLSDSKLGKISSSLIAIEQNINRLQDKMDKYEYNNVSFKIYKT